MSIDHALQALNSYHNAAVALIAPGNETRDFSLQTMSGINPAHFMALKEQVRGSGETIVALIYDTELPSPMLKHVWLMRPTKDAASRARGDDLDLIIDCKLWSAANDGPILILGPKQFDRHFVISDDRTRLVCRDGKPFKDIARGHARACARIARLAKPLMILQNRGAPISLAA